MRISDYFSKEKPEKKIKVNFVGSGEPLLSWANIRHAVRRFHNENASRNIKFYTVTNGTLLTEKIIHDMKVLEIFPSISLDGPPDIHDKNRIFRNGRGSFDATMRGINLLRKEGFEIAINTTITSDLIENREAFVNFVITEGFEKVIFDKLVFKRKVV